jgi:tripartite-type tricarboxylate transporter receptor subunit TctC
VPGYEYASWNAVFVPRGTPKPIGNKLHANIQKALADPEVVTAYAAQGLTPSGSDSPQLLLHIFAATLTASPGSSGLAGINPE